MVLENRRSKQVNLT